VRPFPAFFKTTRETAATAVSCAAVPHVGIFALGSAELHDKRKPIRPGERPEEVLIFRVLRRPVLPRRRRDFLGRRMSCSFHQPDDRVGLFLM